MQKWRNFLKEKVQAFKSSWPEIGINSWFDAYDIATNEENDAGYDITAPNCPFGEMILMESEMAVRSVKDVNLAKINLTFDPPWNPDIHVSDEAKYQMGIL